MNEEVVLNCQQLSKTYEQGGSKIQVLDNINLQVSAGERVAIVGKSGSGKSTLLNLMGGLDAPTRGDVEVAGQRLVNLNEDQRGLLRNKHLGFVYQFHHLLPEFSALENVAMPLLIGGLDPVRSSHKAESMLAKVGLAHRVDHKPAELSGGERQRVAIARALVTKPDCVLMDEPTGNLDSNTAIEILDVIEKLNEDFNISFVIVTHDRTLAGRLDRVLELQAGNLQDITLKTSAEVVS